MSPTEKRLVAEQRKLQALRERIQQTTYMKASEVRAHLHMGRHVLYALPMEVLPYIPSESGERRYNPADVAAYPARSRRWRDGGDEALKEMGEELAERDRLAIERSMEGAA